MSRIFLSIFPFFAKTIPLVMMDNSHMDSNLQMYRKTHEHIRAYILHFGCRDFSVVSYEWHYLVGTGTLHRKYPHLGKNNVKLRLQLFIMWSLH